MLDLFDVPWADLTLDSVRRFLDGAEDEPLLWEAKGTKLDPHAVRKAAGAFANSHDGGYLILGAEAATDGWKLDGVQFPEEPQVWLSSTVRAGLRPAPHCDVSAFATDNGHVAVLKVPPLDDPPCITRGTVYERIPGQSVPVKDPQRLAELYRRGEEARRAAQVDALAVCDELALRTLLDERGQPLSGTGFCIGLATTGRGPDIVGSLFSRAFTDSLSELLRNHSQIGRGLTLEQTQSALWVVAPEAKPLSWAAYATWDGAIAIAVNAPTQAYWPEEAMVGYVTRTWQDLLDAAHRLGGSGAHAVAVRVKSTEWFPPPLQDEVLGPERLWLLQRGPVAELPNAQQQQRMQRELRRIAGYQAFEDE